MNSWTIFSLAFAAVVLYSWASRRNSPHWYLNCAVPLLYGGVVAWMFLGENPLLVLQVLIFGTILPVLLLAAVWLGGRPSGDQAPPRPKAEEQDAGPARHTSPL